MYETKKLSKTPNERVNETIYNNSFSSLSDNKDIILADKILVNNVEICDLIVFYNEQTYLICNKATPQGSSARDLFNQIKTSANLLHNSPNIINLYYHNLVKNGKIDSQITKEFFFNKISNAKYIAAFVKNPFNMKNKIVLF